MSGKAMPTVSGIYIDIDYWPWKQFASRIWTVTDPDQDIQIVSDATTYQSDELKTKVRLRLLYVQVMVLILDGSSDNGGPIWSKSGISIC